jgi:mannose-1-phosphate guanylyltransferase
MAYRSYKVLRGIMDAIILAGGFGTRLRPLTLNTPKPLVPVANQPFLGLLLERLRRAGIRRVALSVFYGAKEIGDWAKASGKKGVVLKVVRESRPLGTGGAIRFAWLNHAQSVLVLNGDILSDYAYRPQIKAHCSSGADATLWVRPVKDPSAFGVVEFDDLSVVKRFVEKPRPGQTSSRYINAGTYVLSPSVRSLIPAGRTVSVEREVFPLLLEKGLKVKAFTGSADAYWMDLGTPANYLKANLDACEKKGRILGPGCRLDVSSRVEASVLGWGCVVGAGARIKKSVLWPGCQVGRGARVHGSLLGKNVMVGDGVVLKPGTVLGDDAVVTR